MATGKTTERDGSTCFKNAFGNVTEFGGFDDTTHTRLNLPKPVYAGSNYQLANADNGIAPDHGKPWERYVACAQATKLVPVCKQKGIALDAAKAAADGWVTVTALPTIPALPSGYNLDPGDANCRMAYQWDAYCREHKMSK